MSSFQQQALLVLGSLLRAKTPGLPPHHLGILGEQLPDSLKTCHPKELGLPAITL